MKFCVLYVSFEGCLLAIKPNNTPLYLSIPVCVATTLLCYYLGIANASIIQNKI